MKTSNQNNKNTSKKERTITYAQIQTMKGSQNTNKLLPGLQIRNKSSLYRKTKVNIPSQPIEKQQPYLLTTAVQMIKNKQQQFQELQNQTNKLSISNYFNSRQITPINPLLGNNLGNNSMMIKKRVATHQTNKSRLQSINSQLKQNENQDGDQQDNFLHNHIYKIPGFMLHDVTLGQSQAVFQYTFGQQRKVNPKLMNLWKECLLHQDKVEIFVQTNPEEPSQISYTHPKIFPLNELQKGFDEIFGSGKNRCLKPGEQALVIQGIRKYLKKCDQEPMKIARKDFDIISDILVNTKLRQLENYPMCYKQIQGHLKIMFTRWKYLNQQNKTDKMIEAAIINGKNHFIDLGKPSVLSQYLLKYSNKNQIGY